MIFFAYFRNVLLLLILSLFLVCKTIEVPYKLNERLQLKKLKRTTHQVTCSLTSKKKTNHDKVSLRVSKQRSLLKI